MSGAGDTIVAIATGSGAGGIGIVRLSGPRAHAIGEALAGKPLRARRAHAARFRDAASGETLDHGLALRFDAPASFTGEDVVELHAHGSGVTLARLVRAAVALGARPARAGEFSERAFLAGKLDLAQAEAIADLIAAGSEAQARAALRSLEGEFSRRVEALLDALIALRIQVEAAIDFPEEELDVLAEARVAERLDALRAQLDALRADARRGRRLRDGLHVVIVGRPNAGKSSLLNALAGSERAIVTALPGTTRDLLRETVQVDGLALTLVDTAGLREAADAIEAEGVRRARAELTQADLALVVLDASLPPAQRVAERAALAAETAAVPARLWLHNKSDLAAPATVPSPTPPAAPNAAPEIPQTAGIAAPDLPEPTAGVEPALAISARTGAGLDALRALLRERAGGADAGGTFSARERHVAALDRVAAHLADAATVLGAGRAAELAADDLRHAQHALSEITGAFTSDDLLGRIFQSFCIGK